MIRTKSRWAPPRARLHPPSIPVSRPLAQRLAAQALLAAGAVLDRLIAHAALPARRAARPAEAEVEFYAQAGAPEGALYVDGQFVGWLPGVQRL